MNDVPDGYSFDSCRYLGNCILQVAHCLSLSIPGNDSFAKIRRPSCVRPDEFSREKYWRIEFENEL